MQSTEKRYKKNYKTGKDIFSRYNGILYFVTGCVISVPFSVVLIMIDRFLGI